MYGVAALLAQEDFIEVGLEDIRLRVMQFQQHGHDCLVDLARQGALVGEVVVLDQLLGQRAAPLHRPARPDVGQHCARYTPWVHAVVMFELAVLDRLQAGEQQLRSIADAQQRPVFLMQRVDRGKFGRVQPNQVQRCPVDRGAQLFNPALFDVQPETQCLLIAVIEAECAPVYLEPAATGRVAALDGCGSHLAVAGRSELPFERHGGQPQAAVQTERARIDPAWQIPLAALEFGGD